MSDSIEEMICELQRTVPPVYLADEREAWLQACHTVLSGVRDVHTRYGYATTLAICLAVKSGGTCSHLALKEVLGDEA